MARGFVYLVAVIDVASRKVLAHKVANSLEAIHAKDVIEQAFKRYGVPQIVNTDQGSQFTAAEFTQAVLSRGCQLHEHGADYILSLKANQRHMHAVVQQHFETHQIQLNCYSESTKGHGRQEKRTYCVSAIPEALERAAEHWPGLTSVVQVIRQREQAGQPASCETSYYISSLPAQTGADVFAHSIRAHWAVENQLHWSLDVAMREDAAQSYKDQGPHNQTLLRRMALQLLKKDTSVKIGVKVKRKRAGWDTDYLARIIGVDI